MKQPFSITDIWVMKDKFTYNEDTLKVLASISAWTIDIRNDITAEKKLKIIRDELERLLP